jgi:hypothetical protein
MLLGEPCTAQTLTPTRTLVSSTLEAGGATHLVVYGLVPGHEPVGDALAQRGHRPLALRLDLLRTKWGHSKQANVCSLLKEL